VSLADSECYGNCLIYAHSYSDAYADCYGNCLIYAHGYAYCYTNGDSYGYPDHYT
jgi:hypothetical protein